LRRLAIAFLMLWATAAGAIEWYASPNGSSNGTGTVGSPLDIYTAFTNSQHIVPGDMLWLRGTNHGGAFIGGWITNYLDELAMRLPGVTAKPYPGEWGQLSCTMSNSHDILHIYNLVIEVCTNPPCVSY